MAINRKVFFEHVRTSIVQGSLATSTVRGCNAVLDEWERRGLVDLRWLADMLATVRGECGPNMLPVREGFKKTDEEARAFITRQGYKYAKIVNGHMYYGRGLVQITHDYNYKKMGDILGIDLVNNPDQALEPRIAAGIMFEGMIRGTFTGKKLADYFNEVGTDWLNARRIINGMDRAQQFAEWAKNFYAALSAASAAKPEPVSIPEPKPKPTPKPTTGPNVGGAVGGAVVLGGGVIVANQTAKKGASVGEIAVFVGLSLVIALAVGLIIRHIFKRN